MMTDDQLYQSYLAGDASAGDELMLRNSDALTAYLAAVSGLRQRQGIRRAGALKYGASAVFKTDNYS